MCQTRETDIGWIVQHITTERVLEIRQISHSRGTFELSRHGDKCQIRHRMDSLLMRERKD